ncbi:MAG TPA: efflux RND transporter permease subunit, partial [Pirellulaceae bacterium]|nr:efflux RND transporter permease subunit [Pirellulaceae bacterium]
SLGPALRRGALDKAGAEAVGGVTVVRYGFNPLEAIRNVKKKIEEVSPGLPSKVVIDYTKTTASQVDTYAANHGLKRITGANPSHDEWVQHLRTTVRAQWPNWITTSQIRIVPFYDRTGVIYETLGTLNTALSEEILVTIIVILVMVLHLRSSLLISALLPLAVLMCFIAMKTFGVDANIVALSGIAIAIGTMVDMGIILCENILKHLDEANPNEDRAHVIFRAANEVASAVLTAVSTTVVSFLPVFTMVAAEGKLFRPLAFTKTFALAASVIVALTIIPPAAHILMGQRMKVGAIRRYSMFALVAAGLMAMFMVSWWVGAIVAALGIYKLLEARIPANYRNYAPYAASGLAVIVVGFLLTDHWLPLGPEKGIVRNFLFVGLLIGGLLGFFTVFQRYLYEPLLRWCLAHKLIFLSLPTLILMLGGCSWLGFDRIFSFIPKVASSVGLSESSVRQSQPWVAASNAFPGIGKEFMPPLDEGSFLYMPTTMPHASIGEAMDVLQLQNRMLVSIPEVESVVGKIGRADSPLDPAPISMIETFISYKSEYKTDQNGNRLDFRYDEKSGEYARDENGDLIEDPSGRPFRQWRDKIKSPNDIWEEITKAADIPGTTSAPKLQPIAARIVMLQSGMRAPMGMKIKGPDLETIERVALQIEGLLKQVPTIQASAVIADRIV